MPVPARHRARPRLRNKVASKYGIRITKARRSQARLLLWLDALRSACLDQSRQRAELLERQGLCAICGFDSRGDQVILKIGDQTLAGRTHHLAALVERHGDYTLQCLGVGGIARRG